MKNCYWLMKYNTLILKTQISEKNLLKELKNKINEINELKIENKELRRKATLKNKIIRELKETNKNIAYSNESKKTSK